MVLDPDFDGLQEASGLDTSPEWELVSPKGLPPPEVTSSHSAIRKAAELLDLPLPSSELKSSFLTEVLHSLASSSKALLPISEDLTELILKVWQKV